MDDATRRLMQLHFVPTESSFAYFEATRAYLQQHGKPVAFYSDKASIFRPTTKAAFSERGVTQFARVLYELNIEAAAVRLHAHRPLRADEDLDLIFTWASSATCGWRGAS